MYILAGTMEPHYKSLVVALIPQPRKMPLPPFDGDDLQRVFSDVSRNYAYEALEFIYDRRGAKFSNGEDDFVELRPALLQLVARMDGPDVLTTELAEKKAVRVLRAATERLKIPGFLQCSIQAAAVVEVPGSDPDAKKFVAERLMGGADHPDELGHGFFGGGVRYRRLREEGDGEDTLYVEPFLQENSLLFLNHQVVRVAGEQAISNDLDQVGTLIEEAFEFLSGPTMRLLEK
jgi:hypothetical protein